MKLNKYFKYKSLLYHHGNLSADFDKSLSITRNKSTNIPKFNKTMGFKNSYVTALKPFNLLPNSFKRT